MVAGTELLLDARGDHQHRHVEAAQVHFGDLALVAEAVVADDDEQGFVEVLLFARLLEELAERPIGVAHGGQVFVEAATVSDALDRQWRRQGVRRVVGQGLQQRVERLAVFPRLQFLQATIEHVLVGHAPGRIGEHRIDEVVAANEVGHALVAEEARLVIPGEVAVVDVDIVIVAGAEQLRQAGQFVAAFRGLHQVFETRQVGEAGHGREHALVGVGAVGEETVEQQTFLRQLVQVRGDIARRAQSTDRVTGHAFHQDHHDVLDRQGLVGRRHVVAANSGDVGIDQFVVRHQQHVAHHLLRLFLRQGGFPDVVAVFAHARLGCGDQRQRAVEAELVGEVGIGGVDVTPAHRRALTQGAASGDHADQQANHEHRQAGVPRRNLTGADAAAAERSARAGGAVGAFERQGQNDRTDHPRQHVAHHRETVPEHAHYGFRVFLHVLEHQTIEALVKLAVEVHLHQAEEQRDARCDGQPQTEETARGHGPGTEQRQHQRNAQVDHQAQVETQTVDERFKEGRGWGVEDHLAVVDQQREAQRGKHDHHDQCAQQRVGQMRFDGRLQQASRRSLLIQGVRVCHVVLGPIGS